MENNLNQETSNENEGTNMRKPRGRPPRSRFRRGAKAAKANLVFVIFFIIGLWFLFVSWRAGETSTGVFVLVVIVVLFLLGG